MGFRVPLKSLLRDIVIMCCGSILGLLLAKTFVGDSARDRCDAIHMVKRSGGSWRVVTTEGMANISQNYTGDEGRGGRGEGDGMRLYATESGWVEEGEDSPREAEEEEMENVYVPSGQTGGGKY